MGSAGPSSHVGSGAMFGGGGGEDSASPVTYPIAPAQNASQGPIRVEQWSDADSDEEKKSGRMHWAEEDNLRLVSAWLHNSNDPIDGNGKKGPHYWKEVAAEYNAYAPKGKERTAMQLKNHWNTTSALVMKFHGCWTEINNTYRSGYSDEQVMDMVQEEWKRVKKTEKPFPYVYWWRAVREEPKWLNRDVAVDIMNKRNKVSSSGAYTSSSNRDTDDAADTDRPQPLGQKQAKEQRKAKGKGKVKGKEKVGKGQLSEENLEEFNNLQDKKTEAIEKMAAAAREHAAAIDKMAEADKEKVKMDKIKQLTELMKIDTNSYSPTQKARHEKLLDFLTDEIYRKE
ncbi:unnamed protein product [Urochloa decumbens]|uniref:No apical meristem-associated C-terminal domain-containing protein n=1 Tax=Urochloa decumbens TaxID=240449 RepID=A0ABC9D754_9POAL